MRNKTLQERDYQTLGQTGWPDVPFLCCTLKIQNLKKAFFRICSHLMSFFKLPVPVLHYNPME